ncbi:MAG: lysophospholipid acyltransferase family protein [Cypionkella sp.]
MSDWKTAAPPEFRVTPMGWLRVLWRGGVLGLMTYGGLVVLLLVRLIERPLFGPARPWTPYITQSVCRAAFVIMGIGTSIKGEPMTAPGAMVANHASWMDIFALNAAARVYFVAKSEVEAWAGIGWLARATGTVFIARKGAEAKRQQEMLETRLRLGHRLLFFPEGTSTDALRVLPFKSTLFAAFFSVDTPEPLQIQPVTVTYHAPKGEDPRHYGWWGTMTFMPHLLKVLSDAKPGRIEIIFHPPVPVRAFPDRKTLAAHCERVIRTSHVLAE